MSKTPVVGETWVMCDGHRARVRAVREQSEGTVFVVEYASGWLRGMSRECRRSEAIDQAHETLA